MLRRTFELRGEEGGAAFGMVYEGVLRDLDLTDAEVKAHLAAHGAEIEAAIGRTGGRR